MQDEIVTRIITERNRRFDLPGAELDVKNSPADWSSAVGHYLFEEIRRGAMKPNRENYEDCLVKAAAVIIAALEHCEKMENNHFFEVKKFS